jgi:hypothetical protein
MVNSVSWKMNQAGLRVMLPYCSLKVKDKGGIQFATDGRAENFVKSG